MYIIGFCFVLKIYILHYPVYFYINHFIIFILSLNWYIYIYVKPMHSMVLDNKQYNTYSTIRVQSRLSLILLGYTIKQLHAIRELLLGAPEVIPRMHGSWRGGSPDTPCKIKIPLNYIIKSPNDASDTPLDKLKKNRRPLPLPSDGKNSGSAQAVWNAKYTVSDL